MEKTDIIIVGAGAVGLALAAEFVERKPGLSVAVLEKNETFGQETSSRNSEVIHAGIYYPTGSLKAQLCVSGKEMLYSFLERWGIGHRKSGKLIIARDEGEIPELGKLNQQAAANGVLDLVSLDRKELKRLEPHVEAKEALLSPSTGVLNSHQLMERLEQNAMQKGALFAYCHEVTSIEPLQDGYDVHFTNPDGSSDVIACSKLINSAGLACDKIAAMAGIDIDATRYRLSLLRGEYFSVAASKSKLINRLIYTPPEVGLKSLGIHTTKTLDGRLRLGPSADYVDYFNYTIDDRNRGYFYDSVKDFLPFLDEADLEPEMVGYRSKLKAEPDEVRDYIIAEESERGLPGLINLIGIESPGLTSCLAIARHVVDLADL